MPPFEYGYMEGEELGRPYDLRLLARLASYARSQLGRIMLAALLILLSTGLDLLLPYFTRQGIDGHILRQAQQVLPGPAGPELLAKVRAQSGPALLDGGERGLFLPEAAWRALDPRLNESLRQAGAVAPAPWYVADPQAQFQELLQKRPGMFLRVGDSYLIRTPDLKQLSPQEMGDLRAPDVHGLIWLAFAFLLTAVASFLLGYGQQIILERAGQEMMFSLRQGLFRHMLTRSLDFFAVNPVGKLVTRLTNDVQNLNELFTSTLVALFQDIFLVGGIVVVLFWLDSGLALACLSLAPVIAALAWLFSRLARDAFRDLQGHLGRINSKLSETLQGLAVLKLFRAEAHSQDHFRAINQDYYRAGLRQIKVFSIFMPLTELLSSLALALILWYGGGQVIQDRLSLGTLVAFVAYMQMFFRPVRDIAEKYNIMQSAMASAERIFQLMDDPRQLPLPENPREEACGPGEVRLEDVSFGYDPARPVLSQVSFTIPTGQTWAVVGPTGAGKSSLVNLVLRLRDPQQGRVLLDGIDVRQLSPEALARQVALVAQEVFLLAGSVEENIRLGRPWVSDAMLTEAMAVSGVAEFIPGLEQGLATPLGEGGHVLSAGQRQLLSLARALAGQPRVLILDEATSSVDPESERLIQSALPRVMAGRTCLVVAHRLTTIRRAHRILVMRRGLIVEQGTHEELLAQQGLYHRLLRLQQIKDQEGAGHGPGDQG